MNLTDEKISRRTLLVSGLLQPAALALLGSKVFAQQSFESNYYPDPRIQALDKRFKFKLGNAAVERLATGFRWTEGPVYFRDQRCLIFSDIPNNRLMRWAEEDGHVSVFRSPSNYVNGNTRDRQGRLVSCEHGGRRVVRTEYNGAITVLADTFEGKKFNAPNDLVVDSQNAVWFTDPGYGILANYEGNKATAEMPNRVYRIDSGGKVTMVADDLARPNGICFSPDEKQLYIVDSENEDGCKTYIKVYDVDKGMLKNGKQFATGFGVGTVDGIKVDVDGNLWCGMGWDVKEENGVRCYSASGDLIGKILLPELCSNLCFGGRTNSRLFMTTGTSVYSVFLNTVGV